MIKIDDGIPVPVVRKRGPLTKWPFADLQIGQSFASHKQKPSEASLRTQAYSAARELGRKFTVATVIENNRPVIRVWRIK